MYTSVQALKRDYFVVSGTSALMIIISIFTCTMIFLILVAMLPLMDKKYQRPLLITIAFLLPFAMIGITTVAASWQHKANIDKIQQHLLN